MKPTQRRNPSLTDAWLAASTSGRVSPEGRHQGTTGAITDLAGRRRQPLTPQTWASLAEPLAPRHVRLLIINSTYFLKKYYSILYRYILYSVQQLWSGLNIYTAVMREQPNGHLFHFLRMTTQRQPYNSMTAPCSAAHNFKSHGDKA